MARKWADSSLMVALIVTVMLLVKRRGAVEPALPDERLWRFRSADWLPLRGLDAYHAYRAERLEWCAGHGITPAELARRVPKPVVADRVTTAPTRGAGSLP